MTVPLHLAVFIPDSDAVAVPIPLFATFPLQKGIEFKCKIINTESNQFFYVLPAGFSLGSTASASGFCVFPTERAAVAAADQVNESQISRFTTRRARAEG